MPVLKEAAALITMLGCGRGQNLTIIGAMALRGLVGEITFRARNGCSSLQDLCNSGISP